MDINQSRETSPSDELNNEEDKFDAEVAKLSTFNEEKDQELKRCQEKIEELQSKLKLAENKIEKLLHSVSINEPSKGLDNGKFDRKFSFLVFSQFIF